MNKTKTLLNQYYLVFVISTLVLLSVSNIATGARWPTPDDYESGIKSYIGGVEDLLMDLKIHAQANPDETIDSLANVLVKYLKECKLIGEALLEIKGYQPPITDQLKVVGGYSELKDGLIASDFPKELREYIREEYTLYTDNIKPLLESNYLNHFVTLKSVYDIKYFAEDNGQANFLEGWVNGHVGFLAPDEGVTNRYRLYGISKFEMTLRTEPLEVINSTANLGYVFGPGLLYNFFPEIEQQTGDQMKVKVIPGFLSEYIKRFGMRGAIGLQVLDNNKGKLLYGGGLQVRALSGWVLYSEKESGVVYGVSLNTLDFIKGYLPF